MSNAHDDEADGRTIKMLHKLLQERTLERDAARADVAVLQGVATAARALENVRMLAIRLRRTDPENAAHLLRFCESAGVFGSPLRGGVE